MLRIDWNLLLTMINPLLLFVLMKIFLFQPVQKIISARQQEADRQLQEAAQKNAQADGLITQYRQSIADAEEEKNKLLQETLQKADAEYQRILVDAQEQAKQLKEEAVSEAEIQKRQILKKAEKEIADMVICAATKVMGEKRGADIDRSLYHEFLDKAGDKQ